MDHKKILKEQLLHLAFGAMFFVVIGACAVGLDLASSGIKKLGVSEFTSSVLEIAAHSLMVLDLVLFFVYVLATSYELAKGMLK